VDLANPERRIVLEADSFRHHADRGAFRNDCRRYDELVRIGWGMLRFAWEHVMFERGWVAEVVSDCYRRR
jgi:very-short-patch-repair endonuclease